ncbi:MAG: response regulator [Verrucomicrobiaceae bacterium]|nr:MAG: response regulator [Verrucomicrobiaceae bacterium]
MDDEPLVREVLDACLSVDGHSIKSVSDAREALIELHAENWDLVLTDRMMPGLSGEELAAEIKRFDPYLPVVLVTGMPEIVECGSAQAVIDGFLRKPFTQQSLRDGIASALTSCSHRPTLSREDSHGRAA